MNLSNIEVITIIISLVTVIFILIIKHRNSKKQRLHFEDKKIALFTALHTQTQIFKNVLHIKEQLNYHLSTINNIAVNLHDLISAAKNKNLLQWNDKKEADLLKEINHHEQNIKLLDAYLKEQEELLLVMKEDIDGQTDYLNSIKGIVGMIEDVSKLEYFQPYLLFLRSQQTIYTSIQHSNHKLAIENQQILQKTYVIYHAVLVKKAELEERVG